MTTSSIAVAPTQPPDVSVDGASQNLGLHRRYLRVVEYASNRAVQAAAVAIVALILRLIAIRSSFDLFIDEVTYTRIGANLASGQGVTLDGRPFNLHPPAFMAVLALVINIFGLHGNLQHQLLALRPVSAVFGAVSCAGAYLLVARAAGRRYALILAALIALNPFVILYDSQVMLEAMAQAATVGLFCFLAAAVWTSNRIRLRCTVAAGLCGAIAVCTKETFGLVLIGALIVLWVTKWVLPRRQVAIVAAITVAGYVCYVVSIGIAMGFEPWWTAKSGGVLRLLGIDQQTGFNAPSTHVSLLSRVFAHGATDGVTYALLGLGGLASVALVWRWRPWRKEWDLDAGPQQRVGLLVAVWALCASGYLAYAIAFGSLEEQMFYIMVLPTTAGLCIWASITVPTWHPNWRKVGALVMVLALAAEGAVWGVVHTSSDNTYEQLLAWEPSHVAFMSTISVTEDTAQFLIHEAVLGNWNTLAELRAHHVDYVLLSTTLVDQGYGSATKSFQDLLDRRATIVFEASGSSSGSLRLYDVRQLVSSSP